MRKVSVWKHDSPNFLSINDKHQITKELSWHSHQLKYLNTSVISSVFASSVKWTENSEADFFKWLRTIENLTELDISYSQFSDRNLIHYFFSKEAQNLTSIHIKGNHYMLNIIPRINIKHITCEIYSLYELIDILHRFPSLISIQVSCLSKKQILSQDIINAIYEHKNQPYIYIQFPYEFNSDVETTLTDPNFYLGLQKKRLYKSLILLLLQYEYLDNESNNISPLFKYFNNTYHDINILTQIVFQFLL